MSSKKELCGKGVECARRAYAGLVCALDAKEMPYLETPEVYKIDFKVVRTSIPNLCTIQIDHKRGVLEIEVKTYHKGDRDVYYRTSEVQTALTYMVGFHLRVYSRQDHIAYVGMESLVNDWSDDDAILNACMDVIDAVVGSLAMCCSS